MRGKRRSFWSSPARLRSRFTTSSESPRSRMVKPGDEADRARRGGGARCSRTSGTCRRDTCSQLPPDQHGRAPQHLLGRLAREREQQDLRRVDARTRPAARPDRRACASCRCPAPAITSIGPVERRRGLVLRLVQLAPRSRCGTGRSHGSPDSSEACRFPSSPVDRLYRALGGAATTTTVAERPCGGQQGRWNGGRRRTASSRPRSLGATAYPCGCGARASSPSTVTTRRSW